jgi:hypothetical protein
MSRRRPLSSGSGGGSGSRSGKALTDFNELHNRFRTVVAAELTTHAIRISPGGQPHLDRVIDSGVSHLIGSDASSSEIQAAEEMLQEFVRHAAGVAGSRGERVLSASTLLLASGGGRWCPPFCGWHDDKRSR